MDVSSVSSASAETAKEVQMAVSTVAQANETSAAALALLTKTLANLQPEGVGGNIDVLA